MKLALIILSLLWAITTTAQSVRDVNLCELRDHPHRYNMKWVRVRAQLPLTFEGFALFDPSCPQSDDPEVWIEFGGDQSTPATYCCGSHERKRKSRFEINGVDVPLVRDSAFDLFM